MNVQDFFPSLSELLGTRFEHTDLIVTRPEVMSIILLIAWVAGIGICMGAIYWRQNPANSPKRIITTLFSQRLTMRTLCYALSATMFLSIFLFLYSLEAQVLQPCRAEKKNPPTIISQH